MTPHTPVPVKPFADFKWQWASFAPTESINDPVVLLGVLFRMRKLEGSCRYSSEEFTRELADLSASLKDSVGIDLAGRGGERNVIRNSGQYWKALNLIPRDTHGNITLTDFGRRVADRSISQTEFSALTVMTLRLPNKAVQSEAVCREWEAAGLEIYPLRLILAVCHKTDFLTTEELVKVVIPLSGVRGTTVETYVECVRNFRQGLLDITSWPDCCPGSNDQRMAREFMLFLANYGYLNHERQKRKQDDRFVFNRELEEEILAIIGGTYSSDSIDDILQTLGSSGVVSDVERKRLRYQKSRPNQARFRRSVLEACQRCVITSVCMPEVLEAAHIKPYKYHGEDTVANGLAMRMDIHTLFDSGHLRISTDGQVVLSQRARLDYGAQIPPRIFIPSFINRDFLRWRWENYNGI